MDYSLPTVGFTGTKRLRICCSLHGAFLDDWFRCGCGSAMLVIPGGANGFINFLELAKGRGILSIFFAGVFQWYGWLMILLRGEESG